ncbi:hypothetical protein KG088_09530 [Halomonas sp. TRM85114]|uniref:hypothetical protein n=1 Tax=Halomonas jincaotanensis TaxID=2810616 RepID=UPI001BD2950F|nr:hypothetical protein [Halomonas jincaotanensis]MBS9403871.1 hypothetical protein [Halomonas jincaotanensis]
MRHWPLSLMLVVGLPVLAGCQTSPSTLPVAEPAPSAECRWSSDTASVRDRMRRAMTALEAEGFTVRDTDPVLGLVSAERARILHGSAGLYDTWERTSLFGGYGGFGGRGGFSGGISVGLGGGYGGVSRDATRLERVSLVAAEEVTRVSRDSQLIDWRGEVHETRSASDADFCRRLREAMQAMPVEEASS